MSVFSSFTGGITVEQGTWVPVISAFGIGAMTGTITGSYRKIGSLVVATMTGTGLGAGTASPTSASAAVSLPFTVDATVEDAYGVWMPESITFKGTGVDHTICRTASAVDGVVLLCDRSAANELSYLVSDLVGGTISLTISYVTDE